MASLGACAGLNEDDAHSLIYGIFGGTLCGGLGSVTMLEHVCHWGYWSFKVF